MTSIAGTTADQFDARVSEAIRNLDWWVEQSNYNNTSMAMASTLQALMRFSQGFVDLLRFGRGISEGSTSGLVQDGLRLLIVAGPLIRLGTSGLRLLRATSITQAAGTYNCTWIASLQAVRRAGQQYFLSLKKLFRIAGISEAEAVAITQGTGTSARNWSRLQQALSGLGIRAISHSFNSLQELVQVAQSSLRSVFIFSIEYASGAGRSAHTLHAAVVRGSVKFFDTSGRVYGSLAELTAQYPSAVIHSHTALEIPHSVVILQLEQLALTSGGAVASGNAIDIGLQVIPPLQIRGVHGYGYTADGRRVGNWPEGLTSPPTRSGTRGVHGYGCDVNNRPVGRWPTGMRPECD